MFCMLNLKNMSYRVILQNTRSVIIMFYEQQDIEQKENYKKMLTIIGNLTQLFSESDCPYLPYRVHENVFCKYFNAENLARLDCSADAKKGTLGVGLKTWTGQDDQKVAEFGRLRETFADLSGIELVKKIAEYRNERIRITKNLHGIDELIYHIIKRVPNSMQIVEYAFDYIDIDNIRLLANRGNVNNTYFTDGKHTYHFSTSKNTLYMIFENLVILDEFDVEIMDDPYSYLMNLAQTNIIPIVQETEPQEPTREQICLRLYATKASGEKFVFEKSGLNQWNAGGRRRDPDEIYIPYPAEDRTRNPNFFPPRDTVFQLTLPDGTIIPAKVCQDNSKAIMSNPNKVLGEWLLRKVFELPINTVVTYEMLLMYGIDSVVFTHNGGLNYSVDFAEIGTYESFYGNEENY